MTRRPGSVSYTPEYSAWSGAKQRCTNPKLRQWKDYGGRGITMCAEWHASFKAFLDHIGPRPDGMVLDRIDNDRGYEPGNVRWTDRITSADNQRHDIPHGPVNHRPARPQQPASPRLICALDSISCKFGVIPGVFPQSARVGSPRIDDQDRHR